ncbi:Uncharacterised protein [Candidatus Tiddalikarchaeum anstoanum]|nr:Uncharacterised protein [Candidatus Tiddalikarchaeum anstoanum]
MEFLNSVTELMNDELSPMEADDSEIPFNNIEDEVRMEVEKVLNYFLQTYGDYKVAS